MFKFGFSLEDVSQEVATAYCSGNIDEAQRLAREDEKKASSSKDKGKALCAYVRALLAARDTWNARVYAEQLLDLAKKADDKLLKAEAMHAITKVNVQDSTERRVDSAERSLTQKEFINRNFPDEELHKVKPSEAALKKWSELKPAMAYCAEKAEELYKAAGSAAGEASVVSTKAAIALKGKKIAEAQRLAETAVGQFRKLGSKSGEASALYQLYEIQKKDESFDDAVETLQMIEGCFDAESTADASAIGHCALMSAELSYAERQYTSAANFASKATEFFHTAMEAFHSSAEGSNKATALLLLAKSLRELGNDEDSQMTAEAAAEHYKAAFNKIGQARALEVIGGLLIQQKKGEYAVFTLKEAAFLYRQVKNVHQEALTLNAVSKLMLQMIELGAPGGEEECLRHANRAIFLFDDCYKIETHECAEANLTAAKLLCMSKDAEEAEPLANESLRIVRELDNKAGEAAALGVKASIKFLSKKGYDEGEGLASEARDIARDLGDSKLLDSIPSAPSEKAGGQQQDVVKSHIDIIYGSPGGMVKLAKFFEFQGRVARYKSMDGAGPAAGAIADMGPMGVGNVADVQKVDYAIRWTRVKDKEFLGKMGATA